MCSSARPSWRGGLGVPFRSGGGLCGSKLPDAQAAYESANTLWPTLLGGRQFRACMRPAGSKAAWPPAMRSSSWMPTSSPCSRTSPRASTSRENGQAIDAIREVGPGLAFSRLRPYPGQFRDRLLALRRSPTTIPSSNGATTAARISPSAPTTSGSDARASMRRLRSIRPSMKRSTPSWPSARQCCPIRWREAAEPGRRLAARALPPVHFSPICGNATVCCIGSREQAQVNSDWANLPMGGNGMSNKEHVWIPRLKQQLADKTDRPARVHPLLDAARHVGGRRLYVGRQDHRRAARPAGARRRTCPRAVPSRSPMRIPKLDNPHTFSWVYEFERRPPGLRLPDPHRRRQRHAADRSPRNGKHRRTSRPGPSPLPTCNVA